MNNRLTRTTLMILTLVMPLVLWFTRTEDFPSMSAFANAENNPFYHAMHVFGSWFFLLMGAAYRRNWYYWTGFGMGGILFTNMYLVQTVHNIVTATTMGLAVLCMIVYSNQRNMVSNIVMASLAVIIFILGFLTNTVHLFFAEWFAMFLIAVSMIRRIYYRD